jgi:two-component system, chemotaxis family, CheB/CheR fusion protein
VRLKRLYLLRLMKYSPGAIKHINLVSTDIGRPIHHISTNIKFDTLVEDTKLVIEKSTLISKEIEANNGKWYQVMIMPYLQASNKVNGAIVTFNDISELKITQQELNKKNEILTRTNAALEYVKKTTTHDIAKPLNDIENRIKDLKDINSTNPDIAELLSVVDSSVKTLRELATDLARKVTIYEVD